ncbi:MAG: FAD-binding oxidoreductase [Thermodesulfobacteriota bacterium]|nr:FAD-binding oxidoreductase [Thermodesulfobacteriota bacterium]
MDQIYEKLASIVGEAYVSNSAEERFIYSRDPGVQLPRNPDYVVIPDSTEEVQKIMLLANEEKIPIVPLGGGLVLSGLSIPQRGGIVLDMKRMNRIIEVNEMSRYAVVEAGTAQGMLKAYLDKHYPKLKHSLPDAPPVATVVGNIAIHGSGHLSQSEGGFHSDMATGMEVVLPTGEIVKLGSCSTVPYWFSRAPLPDLAGLFLGWNGTTGIITKIGVKLYPKPLLKDILIFMTESVESVPDILYRITGTEMAEDVGFGASPMEEALRDLQRTSICIVANSEDEMRFKKKIIRESLKDYYESKEGGFLRIPPDRKGEALEAPVKSVTLWADIVKGGGFEYVGSIMPVEKLPEAYYAGIDIAKKNKAAYLMGARVVGRGHCLMFFYAYPFNRADSENVERSRRALEDANEAALKIGGIPWKAEVPAQHLILKQMEPNTYKLIKRIKKTLDPNGIMNPGNWEVN